MTRPAGDSPLPSSDASYPAGSDTWSGTPTKVDPGQAAIAAGFVPDQRLLIQHLNWLLNQFGTWIGYQDRLEVMNSTPQYEDFGTAGEEIRTDAHANVIDWVPALSKFFIGAQSATANDVPLVLSSPTGEAGSWVDTSAPVRTPDGDDQTYRITHDPVGRLLGWVTENDQSYFAVRSAAGSWSGFSGAQPTFRAFCAKYYVTGGRWLVGGVESNIPVVYSTTPGDVWTAQTLTGAAATAAIMQITTGNARVVVMSGAGDVWTTSAIDAGAWTHTAAATFDSLPTGLVFVGAEDLWWLLCTDGEVYTSDDGVAWTRVYGPGPGVVPGFPGATTWAAGACAALGGVVVAAALQATPESGGTVGRLAIGWNGGTEWQYLAPPTTDNLFGANSPFESVTELDNRIAFIRENGASPTDGVRLMYTLRV